MKYRKKPIVIEAVQLQRDNIQEVYEFIHNQKVDTRHPMAADYWHTYVDNVCAGGMPLKTLESGEGTQIASIGDYIIKGVEGEFYPCKPVIFKATYEKVNTED